MKQYAKGIYIKKFQGQYGEWLSVNIKKGENNYESYKFYPCKEQKDERFIEFYGVVNDWQPKEKKDDSADIVHFSESDYDFNQVSIDTSEIPF